MTTTGIHNRLGPHYHAALITAVRNLLRTTRLAASLMLVIAVMDLSAATRDHGLLAIVDYVLAAVFTGLAILGYLRANTIRKALDNFLDLA